MFRRGFLASLASLLGVSSVSAATAIIPSTGRSADDVALDKWFSDAGPSPSPQNGKPRAAVPLFISVPFKSGERFTFPVSGIRAIRPAADESGVTLLDIEGLLYPIEIDEQQKQKILAIISPLAI